MPFPLAALPLWLRNMVTSVAASVQADVNMVALAALGALSASVARKGFVGLGQDRFPLHVWLMAIGESGDGKSKSFKHLLSPVRRVVRSLGPAPAVDGPAPPGPTGFQLAKDDFLDDADDASAHEPATLAEAVAVVTAAAATRAGPPRFLLGNITPTTLINHLAEQVTGLALVSPEGGFESWLAQEGPVARSNTGALNQVWDGDSFEYARIGGDLELTLPALTLMIGLQPEIFERFAASALLRSSGFTLRFLFARSDPLVHKHPAPVIEPSVRAEYDGHIYQLLALPGWPPHEPFRLEMSATAAQLNSAFLNSVEQRIHAGGDLRHARSYGRRFEANLPRIAGLLHLARHAAAHGAAVVNMPIDEATMVAAVEIATSILEDGAAILGRSTTGSSAASAAATSVIAAIERLMADPPLWIGEPDDLVARIRDITPPAQQTLWPEGTNNIMRLIRAQLVELHARGITLIVEPAGGVRCVRLTRTEPPASPAPSGSS